MQFRVSRVLLLFSLWPGLLFLSAAYGQTTLPTPKDESEVIRIRTELINVPVTVLDKDGRPMTGLNRSDFAVYEDGTRQEIAEFSTTSAPFEVALLLDTSGSTRGDIELIRRSAQLFIDSLRPGDRVAIIAFESVPGSPPTTRVHSLLTDDRGKLASALKQVSLSYGTPYYDSLVKIVTTVFREGPSPEFRGRRALVALTDGVDSTSQADFAEAKGHLGKSEILSYFIRLDTRGSFESELLGDCETAIRFSMAQIRRYYRAIGARDAEQASNFCELGDFERLSASKTLYDIADREMAELAKASGGKVFEVGDLSEARSAFRSVANEIGTSYSLGYYTTNEARDGKFRQIRVEIKGSQLGTQIRSRDGYFAPKQ
jgi:Ca-activated chloride channel family protein